MKILHISDTHNKHRELGVMPKADVLVHSGDFTLGGSDMEALDFLEWFCDQPYKHKIFIAGNHDDCMIDSHLEGLPENVHYLHDSGVTIDGMSFYGVPMLAEFMDGEMKIKENYVEKDGRKVAMGDSGWQESARQEAAELHKNTLDYMDSLLAETDRKLSELINNIRLERNEIRNHR